MKRSADAQIEISKNAKEQLKIAALGSMMQSIESQLSSNMERSLIVTQKLSDFQRSMYQTPEWLAAENKALIDNRKQLEELKQEYFPIFKNSLDSMFKDEVGQRSQAQKAEVM